ncbi:MAG: FeoA family protein [Bacillota bacterium]
MSQCSGYLSLAELPLGCAGEVVALEIAGAIRRRLLDLGLVPGARITAVRRSPAGDPTVFRIRGALIALRAQDGRRIIVRPVEGAEALCRARDR